MVPAIRFTLCAASDVGRVRQSNEDAFSLSDAATDRVLTDGGRCVIDASKPVLLAVSDGMGGENAGEVASALALQALRHAVAASLGEAGHAETLRKAFASANDIVTTAGLGPACEGMGATLVAALLDGSHAYIAGVGDSRAYVLRRGELAQLTKDETLLQYLIDRGGVPPRDFEASHYRNMLLQAIGHADPLSVSVSRLALRRHDRLLLCSDGLSNELNDAEIRFLLATDLPLEQACGNLIGAANDRGGHDNVTVALVCAEGAHLPEASPGEPVAATVVSLDIREHSTPPVLSG